MFKGITQSISERMGEQHPGNLAVDPATVASSFGVAYPPNQPLPDTGLADHHAENDMELLVLPDLKANRRKHFTPILTMALTRLRSIKPRSREMNQRVAQMIADIMEPLQELDSLVATLEQEHTAAWEARWESDRAKGRELIDVTIPTIQGELFNALNRRNEADAKKGRCKTVLQDLDYNRQKIESARFASSDEILRAQRKVAKAKAEMEAATEATLVATRAMSAVEGRMATAQAQLEIIKKDMDQCQHEILGTPYFHPDFGLSTEPRIYQDKW